MNNKSFFLTDEYGYVWNGKEFKEPEGTDDMMLFTPKDALQNALFLKKSISSEVVGDRIEIHNYRNGDSDFILSTVSASNWPQVKSAFFNKLDIELDRDNYLSYRDNPSYVEGITLVTLQEMMSEVNDAEISIKIKPSELFNSNLNMNSDSNTYQYKKTTGFQPENVEVSAVKMSDLDNRSLQDNRFYKIVDDIEGSDILIFTSDPFIVNKLKGNNPDSPENIEKIKFFEKEDKIGAFLASGEDYKKWMLENKDKVIDIFSLEEASSFMAELAIPKDDQNSYYDIIDKSLEAMRLKSEVMTDIKENCGYSGTYEHSVGSSLKMKP